MKTLLFFVPSYLVFFSCIWWWCSLSNLTISLAFSDFHKPHGSDLSISTHLNYFTSVLLFQAIIALKKGAYLLKYGRRGKPKFCPFRLSNVSFNFLLIFHILDHAFLSFIFMQIHYILSFDLFNLVSWAFPVFVFELDLHLSSFVLFCANFVLLIHYTGMTLLLSCMYVWMHINKYIH